MKRLALCIFVIFSTFLTYQAQADVLLKHVSLVERMIRDELTEYQRERYGVTKATHSCGCFMGIGEHCNADTCGCCGDTKNSSFFKILHYLATSIVPTAPKKPAEEANQSEWTDYLDNLSTARSSLAGCLETLFQRRPSLRTLLQETMGYTNIQSKIFARLEKEIAYTTSKTEEEVLVKPAENPESAASLAEHLQSKLTSRSFKALISLPSGKLVTVDADPEFTVFDLKLALAAQEQIAFESITFIYAGQLLEAEHCLSHYSICSRSILQLID